MKAVPLPFEEFQVKGVLDFASVATGVASASDSFYLPLQEQLLKQKWNTQKEHCYVGTEPTSVLDIRRRNPTSPPTSSSTLSSSHGSGGGNGGGGCGSTDSTTTVAAAAKVTEETPPLKSLEVAAERCGMGMKDWESVLSESPGQDQSSILRLIMGDIEDPSLGLSKLLQSGSQLSHDVEFNGGVGNFDLTDQQGSVLDPINSSNFMTSIEASGPGNFSDFPFHTQNSDPNISNIPPVSLPQGVFFQPQQQQAIESYLDEKPHILNSQFINQNQAHFMQQNSNLVMPLTYAHLQEHQHQHQLLGHQPPAKRLNCGPLGPNYHQVQVPKAPPFLDSGQDPFLRLQQQHQLQLLSQQRPPSMVVAGPKQKMENPAGEDFVTQQLQQALTDQLFKAAELIETGNNPKLAQGILARLNQQVSPIGKPFQRAAYYIKEALQLLLNSNGNNSLNFSPSGLLLKIGAYKSFSEISPVLQFANFTCNQALLEAVEGFDRIHIIDFDIGFGGQWASFMQELTLRDGGAPSLKITAFASFSHHNEIELRFTEENLKQYASEINMPFEIEILGLESLNSASWPQPLCGDCDAIAVNLPICSFSICPSYLHLVLGFVKQLMPKIIVTFDRNCDRTDAPFAQHIIFALQSYSGLLESLDAANVNFDVLQMIEKYFLLPAMEKLVLGRHRERTSWKNLLLTNGFSPVAFSNFTESQADCLLQRTACRGFHVEKRQSSLVLCWQRKVLISVSTWRC